MAKRTRSAAERAAQAKRLRSRPARGRILAAARDLATTHGYEQLRVGELADRAGVSRETFYTHFADKRACLAEATSPRLGEVEQLLRIATEEGEGWAQPILATVDEQLSHRFASAQDPRARIMAAMVELAAEHGHANVRLADLVKASHVSYPSFYRHFESKEQCFVEACRELIEGLEQQVALVAQPGVGRVRSLAEILAADHDVARVLLLEAGGFTPEDTRDRKSGRALFASSPLVAFVTQLLTEVLPANEPEHLYLLSGALVEAMREMLLAGELERVPATTEALLEVLCDRGEVDAGPRRDTSSRVARRRRRSGGRAQARTAAVA